MPEPTREGLIRGIRRWDLVAVVINGIIGAGIFGLPSKVYASIGGLSIIAFIVCGLVVTLIILCFAEVGSRFETTGGPYLYAREAFGPIVGFEVGWLQWLARVTAFAANINLLVEYLSYFWPISVSRHVAAANINLLGDYLGIFGPTVITETWRAIIIIGIVAVLTVVNLVGVRKATVFGNFFTIGKLIPLIFFIAVGLFFLNFASFSFSPPVGAPALSYAAFSTSVLLLIYAFTGFEMAVIPAGEIQNPQRNIPRALITAIGLVATIYILIQVVCIGTLPGLEKSSKPIADASSQFLGAAGVSVISAGAMISIIGNLSLLILAGSRIIFAMSEQKQLPSMISDTHKRFHTPHFAIIATSVVMMGLALKQTFIAALTISAIARLLTYAVTCAALPRFRLSKIAPEAKFKVRGGFVIAVIALALAGWLLSNISLSEAITAGIVAGIGLVICLSYRVSQRRERV